MTMSLKSLFFVLLFCFSGGKAFGYADFISYGYASCMTCHYNGQGGGALNDYGRALFSAEIASKKFFSSDKTDEQLAEMSGFLGAKEIPWWIRPGVKYRKLWYQVDPGSKAARSQSITMQAEANLALHFDEDQKYVLVGSYGLLPSITPGGADKTISRDHYFRWRISDEYILSVGLMDKVFGIRIVDHTAFSRSKAGLTQNDQSHGLLLQWLRPGIDYNFNVFGGNLAQDAALRQQGLSVMAEKDQSQFFRWGGGVLVSKNNFVQNNMLEAHSKWGYGKGHSFLGEVGYIGKSASAVKTDGGYVMLSNMTRLARGYNFTSQVEYYNETMTRKTPDQFKWGLGFLVFPMARLEGRLNWVNSRSLSETGVKADHWMLQGQIHVSL